MASPHFVQSWLPSSNSSWRSADHWMERGALFPETQVFPLKLRISPERIFIWSTKNCRFSICLPKNPCFCHEIEDWTKQFIGIMSRWNKWYVMGYVTYAQTNPRLYIVSLSQTSGDIPWMWWLLFKIGNWRWIFSTQMRLTPSWDLHKARWFTTSIND